MTNSPLIEVLLIDDDIMFAEGVRNFFEQSNMQVAIVSNEKEMRKNLKAGKYPLALLDWNLRDGSHPLESIAILQRAKCRIIVVSDSASGQQQRLCIQAGAHGYIEKGNPILRLLQAAKSVLQNGLDFHDNFPDSLVDLTEAALPELKEHEIDMLIQYICNPLISYKQIALAINSGESWVKECMPSICRKFGAVNKDQLYSALQRHGIIPIVTPKMAELALRRDAKSIQQVGPENTSAKT